MKKGKWYGLLFGLAMIVASGLSGFGQAQAATYNLPVSDHDGMNYVYRFYSPVFLGHFYTTSWNEAMKVANYDSNWTYEGTIGEGFDEYDTGRMAVYRFWSPVFHGHFYTTDYDEMVKVRDTDDNWDYEGIAYYAYPTNTSYDSQTVYRFWSPIFLHHFYTTDEEEYRRVKNTDSNWYYEGEAWSLPVVD